MLYRVFDNQDTLDTANDSWMQARCDDLVCDKIFGNEAARVQVTERWDSGRELKDGRIACQVPTLWADSFGGSQEDLNDDDFVQPEIIDI